MQQNYKMFLYLLKMETTRVLENVDCVCVCIYVCVCVFSSHSFWTSGSLDVQTGVTQEEGHTGFYIHLLSAVRA